MLTTFFLSVNKCWPANILFLRDVWVFHQHWLPCVWSWRSSLAGELTGQRYRACEVDAHNRASTQGRSISKGIVLQDQQLDVNFVIRQRQKVFKRSVERLKIRRCTYVVTGLVSQENQWEWRLSRISEVITSAPDHFWLGSYFYFFGELYIFYISLWGEHSNFRWGGLPSLCELSVSCGITLVLGLIMDRSHFLLLVNIVTRLTPSSSQKVVMIFFFF